MSQKETAAALGISQALLSHYEKGIRECGLSFVIKASEFYGVTCDYLLGKDTGRHGYKDLFDLEKNPSDEGMNSLTACYRASIAMRERIEGENDDFYKRLIKIYELGVYLGLNTCVRSGRIPSSWMGDSTRYMSDDYLKFASGFLRELFNEDKRALDRSEEEAPKCVGTVITHVEKFIDEKIAEISGNKD